MDLNSIVGAINTVVWSDALVYLCLGTGVYFSVLLKFPQVRLVGDMVHHMLHGEESDTGISSFQGFAMALGGRVGTGNIAGVSTAIAMGGPGAVFWMWAIAFLGAGSAYTEAALAQVYKEEVEGEFRGGPAYFIEKGLGMRWYGVLFAIASVLGVGVFLPGVQSNSITAAFNTAFGIPQIITGAVVTALLAFVIFGGTKRISRTAEMIVPFMAIAYIIVALIVIILDIKSLPGVIKMIFAGAFRLDAVFAAIFGNTVAWGVKRGIYSNEAGQGTGPMAAAAAEVSHPAKQGLVQGFSVYVDTLFVCSATAFMILITGQYNVYALDGSFIVENLPGVEKGPAYTQMAINTLFKGIGPAFVAIALFFFAFTTLLAYYFYAESSVAYLFKNDQKNYKTYFLITRIAMLAMTFYGSIRTADLAWGLGDIGVGLMAWLNIIAIILLTKTGVATLRDYDEQKKQGLDPMFEPDKLGIKNAELWNKITAKNKAKRAAAGQK